LIDSSVLVYVQDGTDYSVGSIKDLQDGTLEHSFWYFKDENKVTALIVHYEDAGAQNIFVMINGLDLGSDGSGGQVNVVKGLSFSDGPNATGKSWSYINDNINAQAGLGDVKNAAFSTIVKFRIGEDGILRAGEVIENSGDSDATFTFKSETKLYWKAHTYGTDNTFTLTVDKDVTTTAGTLGVGYVTFDSNAVLYQKSGSSWIALSPTEGNFKANGGSATYVFLNSNTKDKKTYDIIIKQ
jgi:hypothetical protein